MKTRMVTFSYSTVKNASLEVPAEPASIWDTAKLIRSSYLNHAFRPGCGLMSDECLLSSIGKSNFFAGALGGFESRLDKETFRLLKESADNEIALAVDIVRFRNPQISEKAVYEQDAKNEALSEGIRECLMKLAEMKAA